MDDRFKRQKQRLRRFFCALFVGHDYFLKFERYRLFMVCHWCGKETPGWVISAVGKETASKFNESFKYREPVLSSVLQFIRLSLAKIRFG